MRGLMKGLFLLWGLIGFLLSVLQFAGLSGSVGVGTSAYLTATLLLWIGGMVFFGIGSLLSAPGDDDAGELRIQR